LTYASFKDRPVKIDVFDISKIVAKLPSTVNCGELNTFIGFYFKRSYFS